MDNLFLDKKKETEIQENEFPILRPQLDLFPYSKYRGIPEGQNENLPQESPVSSPRSSEEIQNGGIKGV